MSHQTREYSPSSTNAYTEFLGSVGQSASTTRSSGSKPINFLHPYRSAKRNRLGLDLCTLRTGPIHDRSLSEISKGNGCAVDQGTPDEDQWKTRCPRRDTLGTHLLRWYRTASDREGLSDCQWSMLYTRVVNTMDIDCIGSMCFIKLDMLPIKEMGPIDFQCHGFKVVDKCYVVWSLF